MGAEAPSAPGVRCLRGATPRTGAQWRGPLRGKHRYLLLFVGSRDGLARQTREDVFRAIDLHYEVSLELAAQGRFVASRSLGPASTATTLRPGDGGSVVCDGPFAETKEVVAGYFIVACDSKEEAVEIAKELSFGLDAVEVRPIWEIHDRRRAQTTPSRATSSDASSPR